MTNMNQIKSVPLSNKDIERQIRLQIQSEYDQIIIYSQIIDSIQDPTMKKIIEDIIKDEKTHIGKFLFILENLNGKEIDDYIEGIKEIKEEK